MIEHFILKDGEPVLVSFMEWARWTEDNSDRIIAQNNIGDVLVSTIFIGLRTGHLNQMFETMTFLPNGEDRQWRCDTLDEARAQHTAAVEEVLHDNKAQPKTD